jgi:putative tryptophan/tyrosine transport system substrate-binding protein
MATNRKLLWLLTVFLLGSIQLAEAQQSKRVPRIGYLSAGSASSNFPRMEAFRQGLRDLGYIEGKNISVDYRFAEGEYARLPDLVHLNVNIIVTNTTLAARAAKQTTQMIPTIFVNVGDSVSSRRWVYPNSPSTVPLLA